MNSLGKELFEIVKELSNIELQEKELEFAIFNNRVLENYNEKIKIINDNFTEQSSYYGKRIEDVENDKNIIINRYNEEFQKIYDKRKNQYINIINEIQEMQSNQKIALANMESLSRRKDSIIKSNEYHEYIVQKEKMEYIIGISKNSSDIEKYNNAINKLKNPMDAVDRKIIALADKFEKYDGLIYECEIKLKDCLHAIEDDFDSIMKYRNNSLVVPQKTNFFVIILRKIFNNNKKFKKEVIDKMNSEIEEIKGKNEQLLEVIDQQTISLIAKIEELRYNINFEYNKAVE